MAGPLYLAWRSQHGVGELAPPKRGPTVHHPQARKMKGRLRRVGYKGMEKTEIIGSIISKSARRSEACHDGWIGEGPGLGQGRAMVANRMKGMARSVWHGVTDQWNVWIRIQRTRRSKMRTTKAKKGKKKKERKEKFEHTWKTKHAKVY